MLQELSTGNKRTVLKALTNDSHLYKVDEGNKETTFVYGYFEYMYTCYTVFLKIIDTDAKSKIRDR